MNIKEALSQLDALDDDQWTEDGLPKIDTVSKLLGAKVTRAEIIEAAPTFSRENTDLGIENTEADGPTEDFSTISDIEDSKPMDANLFAETYLRKLPHQQLPLAEDILAKRLASIEAEISKLEASKRDTKMSLSLTRVWIKQLVPDISNQEAIRQYIENSHATRAAKAAKIREVFGGLKPGDLAKLDPRAPIDKAFAKQTARGTQRPVGS